MCRVGYGSIGELVHPVERRGICAELFEFDVLLY